MMLHPELSGRGWPSDARMLRPVKLAERVAMAIVHDIAARGLAPLAMLPPEAELLATYGVGRASLREALRLLEVQGLIVMKPGPGGGPMVAGVDSRHFGRMLTLYLHVAGSTFRDVLAARMAIEPVMARLAAERRDGGHLAKLDQFLAHPPDPAVRPLRQMRSSLEFHAMVNGMSGNPVLDLFGQAVRHVYTDRQQGLAYPDHLRERVIREHAEIARAIRDGAADDAERLMREHMSEFVSVSTARYPGMFDELVDWF
jgi:DNA-binding FadR family transcriptional regulator